MKPWSKVAVGCGLFFLSGLAGLGVAAALDDDAQPAPAPGAAERPVDVVAPLAVGAAPSGDALEALSAPGGGASPHLLVGVADGARYFSDPGSALPPEVLDAHCPGDADRACVDEAGMLVDALSEAVPEDADGGDIAEAFPELVGALCGEGEGREACADALPETLGEPSADDGPPPIVDLCAAPEPLPGCEGVGGTVHLATTHPVEILIVTVRDRLAELCRSLGPLDGDELALTVVTDQPVRIEGTYAPVDAGGTAGEATSFDGATTDEGRAWSDANPEDPRTVTCAVLPRPGEGAVAYGVTFDATGDIDPNPASWSGELPIPPPLAPGGETPDEEDPDAGRPIDVRPVDRSTILVDVGVRRDERSSVALVSRDAEQPEQHRCGSLDELRPGDYWPSPYGTRTAVARAPGASDPGPYGARERHHLGTRGLGSGMWDVCVTVHDDFEPPRVVDRRAIPVRAPDRLEFDVFVHRYVPVDPGDGAAPVQPTHIDLTLSTRAGRCEGRADLVQIMGDDDALCSLEADPDEGMFGARAVPQYESGPGRSRGALLALPTGACPGFPPEECPVYYELPILGPPDDASRDPRGRLVLGVRATGTPGLTAWSVGVPEPFGRRAVDPDAPRLDLSTLSVVPHPDDPVNRLLVRWRTDREAEVLATAVFSPERPTDGDACVGGATISSGVAAPATEGVLNLARACPGSRYLVTLLLRDPATPRWEVAYAGDSGPAGVRTVPVDPRTLAARTDRLPISLTVQFRTSLGADGVDSDSDRHVIPSHVHVSAGGRRAVDFSQIYSGRARLELYCARVSSFNRTDGPATVEVGPEVSVGVAMRLHRWSARNDCPDTGAQIRHDRGIGGEPWVLTLNEGVDTRTLLREGSYTFSRQIGPSGQGGVGPPWLRVEVVLTAEPLGPAGRAPARAEPPGG